MKHHHGQTTYLSKCTFFREKAEKNVSLQVHLAQPPYPGGEVTKFQADLRKPASFTWKNAGHLQFSAKWEQIRKGVLKAAGKQKDSRRFSGENGKCPGR